MTAQGVISDGEAREIAKGIRCTKTSPFGRFATSGEIAPSLLGLAEASVVEPMPGRRPGESDRLWERRRDRRDLYEYIDRHGDRGPQPGWGER